jgi:hypothetical protein
MGARDGSFGNNGVLYIENFTVNVLATGSATSAASPCRADNKIIVSGNWTVIQTASRTPVEISSNASTTQRQPTTPASTTAATVDTAT